MVLWITKRAKDREKHETFSRLSSPFVSFVIQTLRYPNLLFRQLLRQRVSLRASAEDPSVRSVLLLQRMGSGQADDCCPIRLSAAYPLPFA